MSKQRVLIVGFGFMGEMHAQALAGIAEAEIVGIVDVVPDAARQKAARLGLQAIRAAGWAPDSVGGLTMGADPVAYAIARASVEAPPLIHAFSVRKAAKEHGTLRRVEGNFAPGTAVVVIEDVITSGASTLEAIATLGAEGGRVLGVLAVVDRQQGGREAIERAGFEVVAFTTTTDLGLR